MADIGHQQTDALLADLEKRIAAEYQVAVNDVQAKLDDYLRRFQIKDDIWQRRVAAGEVSQQEYAQWRIGQMEVGKRWTALRDELATEMHNANVIARSMVDGYLPEAYALNMNYATYQIERDGRVDTGFTLYNRDAVERIIRDQPELLPPPSASLMTRVAAGKDVLWNKGQIQSVMTQSILQGESIPNISKRIANTLGESNHASTIRYARTAVTGAQNAGREAAYQRAKDMGINLRRLWRATLDNRTRHEHRYLDGQIAEVGEPFRVMSNGVEYEIRYPADPEAAGFLIWNCRCRTRAAVEGWDRKSEQLRSYEAIGNMSYEEWLEAKPKSDSIFKQEQIAETMRRSYIRELYGGNGSGSGGTTEDTASGTTDAPETHATPEPEYESFVPAKTKQEAVEFAHRFAESVNYDGISLENANAINEQLLLLSQKYPIGRLDSLGSGKTRGVMSANWRCITINGKKLGRTLSEEEENFNMTQAWDRAQIRAYREKYGERIPRDIQARIDKLETGLKYSRWGVHSSYDDHVKVVLTHEYGHVLSDQYFGMINDDMANPNYKTDWRLRSMRQRWDEARTQAFETGDIFGISKYGSTKSTEFFAECFTAREMGENLPPYIESLMQEVLANGIM